MATGSQESDMACQESQIACILGNASSGKGGKGAVARAQPGAVTPLDKPSTSKSGTQ